MSSTECRRRLPATRRGSPYADPNLRSWLGLGYPSLRDHLADAAGGRSRLRLALDAHTTLAFAAGFVLNVKSGRVVELEQRMTGQGIWSSDDAEPDAPWPGWTFEAVEGPAGRAPEVAAIGLTHDVLPAVSAYVARALSSVGRIVACRPSSALGRFQCGADAMRSTWRRLSRPI